MNVPFFLAFVLGALVLPGCTAPAETTTTAQQATTTLAETTTTVADTSTTLADTTSSTETTTTLGSTSTTLKTVTIDEIAQHAAKGDCWMAIDGKAYDLSEFTFHPGGDAYVPHCGTDATEAFHTKGGKGNDHSQRAQDSRAQFLIGNIA